MGVGETELDLRGPHGREFLVKIDGGVGSGKIVLPAEVGVRVKVDGGLGSVDAHGLTKQSGAWVNEALREEPRHHRGRHRRRHRQPRPPLRILRDQRSRSLPAAR